MNDGEVAAAIVTCAAMTAATRTGAFALLSDFLREDGHYLASSRAYGDGWLLSKRTPVLVVPSVVARPDCNVLINPTHPDFRKITHSKPEPVVWDRRLFHRKGRKQ